MRARLMIGAALLALASCGRGGGENKAAEALPPTPAPANIVINAPDARAEIRTGQSEAGAPAGLPAYPNAIQGSGVNVTTQGGSGAGGITGFDTADPPAQVIAFYATAAEGAGYRIANRMDMGATSALTAMVRPGEAIQITATQVGGVTRVSIIAATGGR